MSTAFAGGLPAWEKDSSAPSLSQRVPGATKRPKPLMRVAPPVLPPSVLERLRAQAGTAREDTAGPEWRVHSSRPDAKLRTEPGPLAEGPDNAPPLARLHRPERGTPKSPRGLGSCALGRRDARPPGRARPCSCRVPPGRERCDEPRWRPKCWRRVPPRPPGRSVARPPAEYPRLRVPARSPAPQRCNCPGGRDRGNRLSAPADVAPGAIGAYNRTHPGCRCT